jgi:hypothetical protein
VRQAFTAATARTKSLTADFNSVHRKKQAGIVKRFSQYSPDAVINFRSAIGTRPKGASVLAVVLSYQKVYRHLLLSNLDG